MSRPSKYSGIVVNLLIAVAISLVVNFSYVLLLVVEKSDDRHPPFSRELRTDREIVRVEGDVWISPDGHGYLLYVSPERLSDGDAAATGLAEVAPARDSVYIPRNSARFLRLRSGDHLLADALESHRSGGRLVLGQVLERNGEPFDYGVIFERPQEGVIFALQLFYFFVLAFLLLSLLRLGDRVTVSDKSGRVYHARASDSVRYPSHCVTVVEVTEVSVSASQESAEGGTADQKG